MKCFGLAKRDTSVRGLCWVGRLVPGDKSGPYPVASSKTQELPLSSSDSVAIEEEFSDKKSVFIGLHRNLGDVYCLSWCSLHQGTVFREEISDCQND